MKSNMIYINDHTEELDIAAALAKVSPQRREQALRFRFDAGRRLSLSAYLLLMEGLKKEYGITEPPLLGYSPEGKPFLVHYPDIHFNLSHSGTVALCAISDQPVGADVEVPRKISPELISYTMSDEEQQQINTSLDPIMQFLYFWTRKEALLKLTAKGLCHDMKKVLEEVEHYHFETIQTEKYIYSVVKHRE